MHMVTLLQVKRRFPLVVAYALFEKGIFRYRDKWRYFE